MLKLVADIIIVIAVIILKEVFTKETFVTQIRTFIT